jgi:hypothetical protein
MSDDIRRLIDEAKANADVRDNEIMVINTPNGPQPIKRRKPASVKPEDVDPSNIKIAPDRELVATLVAQLHDIRSQKRELDDRDSAIKEILQDMAGELEYIALEQNDVPIVSLKHEQSVRLNTARIKDMLPAEDNPELYTTVNSRPLRLI